METDLAQINQRLDQLTALLETQQKQLDLLTQVAQAQQRQLEEIQELKRDVLPIVNHMVKLSINELAEIGSEFQAEDLFFLLKRLLRDTHLLVEGLDRLEMMMDLYDEAQRGGKEVFNHIVMKLDRLERQGYFAFARQGWGIIERIVTEFSEEDVRALGDNIVLILNTIKDMTQPEIMHFIRNTLLVAEREVEKPVDSSPMGLLRQMRDPEVRRGLALTLRVLHVIGAQAAPNGNGSQADTTIAASSRLAE
jgi:uncharacterized protein YjgD (DUF1641 family)